VPPDPLVCARVRDRPRVDDGDSAKSSARRAMFGSTLFSIPVPHPSQRNRSELYPRIRAGTGRPGCVPPREGAFQIRRFHWNRLLTVHYACKVVPVFGTGENCCFRHHSRLFFFAGDRCRDDLFQPLDDLDARFAYLFFHARPSREPRRRNCQFRTRDGLSWRRVQ
jgi:hypothetical protein